MLHATTFFYSFFSTHFSHLELFRLMLFITMLLFFFVFVFFLIWLHYDSWQVMLCSWKPECIVKKKSHMKHWCRETTIQPDLARGMWYATLQKKQSLLSSRDILLSFSQTFKTSAESKGWNINQTSSRGPKRFVEVWGGKKHLKNLTCWTSKQNENYPISKTIWTMLTKTEIDRLKIIYSWCLIEKTTKTTNQMLKLNIFIWHWNKKAHFISHYNKLEQGHVYYFDCSTAQGLFYWFFLSLYVSWCAVCF